ncbi:MAG: YtxH domain-containing protein [Chloroflexi bacterium]|nr:YtxH domain-containing protein [Chloroflexota bacterium]
MFALGILVGAFAGAAVALLMTPMSGNEARKKLSERVDSMRGGEPTGAAWETTSPGNGTPAAPRTYSPTSLS